MLGPSPPSMEKAGSNVQLTITSLWLKLSDLDSGDVSYKKRYIKNKSEDITHLKSQSKFF